MRLNPIWLRVSETLRRLDLALELAGRDAEEQGKLQRRLGSDRQEQS
jgi:hypothetical protein